MRIISTSLPGVLILEPIVFGDKRGFFMEIYNRKAHAEAGIQLSFVQDNLSHSAKGTLRGLHYQLRHVQAKLIQVVRGEIFDVAVDIRRGSPNFGKWAGVQLSEKNRRQVFIPQGFAHGFCVISEMADVVYKCTDLYAPNDEGGILWSDPGLAIDWPIVEPLLSDKDRQLPCLVDIPTERLPLYEESG